MIGYSAFKILCIIRGLGIRVFYNLNREKFLPENAIIVAGNERSGTTWLSDIFSAPKGYTPIIEPIKVNKLIQLGFPYNIFIPPEKKRDDVKSYFQKILSGAIANGYNTVYTPFLKIIETKKWVIKFVRVNNLLPWLVENFNFRYKPLFIIRHPCGTISSHIKFENRRMKQLPPGDREIIEKNFPKFEHLLKKAKTEVEMRALRWGLTNYIPLHFWTSKKWFIISYEQFVLEGYKVLKEIFSDWGMEVPVICLSQLRKKSKQGLHSWSEYSKEGVKILGTWKEYLTKKQINSILDIVHEMGFTEFTQDVEPNYNKLFRKH